MSMTSKERMMRALDREKPDRLPVTIHQWQQYHLDQYIGGMDALDAFKPAAWTLPSSISRRWASSGFRIAEVACHQRPSGATNAGSWGRSE